MTMQETRHGPSSQDIVRDQLRKLTRAQELTSARVRGIGWPLALAYFRGAYVKFKGISQALNLGDVQPTAFVDAVIASGIIEPIDEPHYQAIDQDRVTAIGVLAAVYKQDPFPLRRGGDIDRMTVLAQGARSVAEDETIRDLIHLPSGEKVLSASDTSKAVKNKKPPQRKSGTPWSTVVKRSTNRSHPWRAIVRR